MPKTGMLEQCSDMKEMFYLTTHMVKDKSDSERGNLCYTSRGALAGTRNRLMGPP